MWCSGDELMKHRAAQGDSGGPLVLMKDNVTELVRAFLITCTMYNNTKIPCTMYNVHGIFGSLLSFLPFDYQNLRCLAVHLSRNITKLKIIIFLTRR